jgi:hypothetical protein
MRQRLDRSKKANGKDETSTEGIRLLHTDEHLKKEEDKPFTGIFANAEAEAIPPPMRLKA